MSKDEEVKHVKEKGLMDLSDDILRLIGYMANDDNFIAFPSSLPHWLNGAPLINRKSSKRLRSLRSVNQRLRSSISLSGLHLVIETHDSMKVWAVESPQELRCSVRRLRIDNLPALDRYPFGQEFVFNRFKRLVMGVPNLEELSILDETTSPFCIHHTTSPESTWKDFRLPIAIIPKLRSLAISVACAACGRAFNVSLAPKAAQLEHIKRSYKSFDYAGLSKLFDPRFRSLTSLRLMVEECSPRTEVFSIISCTCENLEELHIIPYDGGILDRCEIKLVARRSESSKQWEWSEPQRRCKRLRELDLFLQGDFGNPSLCGEDEGLSRGDPIKLFDDFITSKSFDHENMGLYQEGMKWAAEQMVSRCPTLKRGWWWKLSAQDVAFRTPWAKISKNQEQHVIIGITPIHGFHEDFTRSTDCTNSCVTEEPADLYD